jgi:hypothetical protein
MSDEKFPYNLPIFRTSHVSSSPDGKVEARIDRAREVGMSNPTAGPLTLSTGLTIENCSPSFLWSDDSQYLAVPQWCHYFIFLGQRLLLVHVHESRIYRSPWYWTCLQPESFTNGKVTVSINPSRGKRTVAWEIPSDLGRFKIA